MTGTQHFLGTHRTDQLSIQLQSRHSGSAGWRQPNHRNGFPTKMVSSELTARMEQGHPTSGNWIWSRTPVRLSQRTRDTGQGQIIFRRRATSRPGNDMVDMEGGCLTFL